MALRPLLLLLFLPTAVSAESVYRWTDAAGESHYTNDRNAIPVEAREGARRVGERDEAEVRPSSSEQSDEQPRTAQAGQRPSAAEALDGFPKLRAAPVKEQARAVPPMPPPPPPSEERGAEGEGEARTEATWRKAFQEMHAEVARAAAKVADAQAELDATPDAEEYPTRIGGGVEQHVRHDEAARKLTQRLQELRTVRDREEDLERAASRQSVPREWRR